MRLSIALDGTVFSASRVASPQVIGRKKSAALGLDRHELMELKDIEGFLNTYATAKIVVIIDTHSLEESGDFIWSGGGKKKLSGCTLHQVCVMDRGVHQS